MRHEIAYGILILLALLGAWGLWRLSRHRRRRPRHINVDLTGRPKR